MAFSKISSSVLGQPKQWQLSKPATPCEVSPPGLDLLIGQREPGSRMRATVSRRLRPGFGPEYYEPPVPCRGRRREVMPMMKMRVGVLGAITVAGALALCVDIGDARDGGATTIRTQRAVAAFRQQTPAVAHPAIMPPRQLLECTRIARWTCTQRSPG